LTTLRVAAIVRRVPGRARSLAWVVACVLACALAAAVVRLAWLCDDAYITLRTVENLLAGHGLVWNVGERVQTFTHPLWFWLLAADRWLTGEHYFTTLFLSMAVFAAAAAVLVRTARHGAAAAAVLLVLLGSSACVDFATSGLETPLSMLLLATLARLDERTAPGGARLGAIAFALGLCGCTRLDLLLLGCPLLLAHVRRRRPLRQLSTLCLALLPLIGWSMFAAVYYGTPFPVTAYAKALSPGIPRPAMLAQGWRYVAYTVQHDPVTMVAIAGGAAAGLLAPSARGRMLGLGVVLGCLWVASVGGDFMSGRFFVPPFALAVALLARWLAGRGPRAAFAVAAAAAALLWLPGAPDWLRPPAEEPEQQRPVDGIEDEQRFYYGVSGLLSPRREIAEPGRFTTALRRQGRSTPLVLGTGMAGIVPFQAGALFHFVDPLLCDPLLARLPVIDPRQWRIGHFARALPDGYLETLAFGGNRIADPGLHRYYETLRTVLSAPLDAPARWTALRIQLLGDDDGLRRAFAEGPYRAPVRRDVPLGDLRPPRPEGTFWFDDPGVQCVGRGGLRLHSPVKVNAGGLHVTVMPLAIYRFRFLDGSNDVGSADVMALADAGMPPAGDDGDVLGYLRRLVGLRRFAVELPAALPPFDTVLVDVQHDPWTLCAIGGFELSP
jgi:arabinofuranosyltransferase